MKTITLSHYTMKDIDPTPWRQTWDNLVHFASRMAPKLAPLGFQLKLRKVELEELTQDNLMSANMVTIACPDNDTPETPIENLLMLELDFTVPDARGAGVPVPHVHELRRRGLPGSAGGVFHGGSAARRVQVAARMHVPLRRLRERELRRVRGRRTRRRA